LGPEARLAGDADDLHEPVGDLGHLELEELLDQLRAAPGDDDARALALGRDVGDHGLDAHAVVVALVPDLLRARKQRLDALAELDQRVAVVRLLDDPRDQLADPVLVLVVHHLALRLADALEDHLLGGLGRDAPEVVGRHVAGRDLVLVRSQDLGIELRLLRLAELTRLGVDLRLGLLGGLRLQLLLQLRRQDELEDPEVGRVAIEVHARVARRPRSLAVGGEKRVLERRHERLRVDPLLLLQGLDGVDYLAAHRPTSSNSGTRLERWMPASGIVTAPSPGSTSTASALAAVSVPVKLRRPPIASRVRTRTRRPTKRR